MGQSNLDPTTPVGRQSNPKFRELATPSYTLRSWIAIRAASHTLLISIIGPSISAKFCKLEASCSYEVISFSYFVVIFLELVMNSGTYMTKSMDGHCMCVPPPAE